MLNVSNVSISNKIKFILDPLGDSESFRPCQGILSRHIKNDKPDKDSYYQRSNLKSLIVFTKSINPPI